MLGFGITIGSAVYGSFDSNASSETTCRDPLPWGYNFIFVPLFALCLLTVNRAKWRDAPVMVVIAVAGYGVSFAANRRFPSQPQVANTFSSLAVGFLGNLYSRFRLGTSFLTILPAIFVLVPSGLAAQGSLMAGIENANSLFSKNSPKTTSDQTVMFDLAFSMVQIAISITVGLFVAALVVYPTGKRRSGLFSF